MGSKQSGEWNTFCYYIPFLLKWNFCPGLPLPFIPLALWRWAPVKYGVKGLIFICGYVPLLGLLLMYFSFTLNQPKMWPWKYRDNELHLRDPDVFCCVADNLIFCQYFGLLYSSLTPIGNTVNFRHWLASSVMMLSPFLFPSLSLSP